MKIIVLLLLFYSTHSKVIQSLKKLFKDNKYQLEAKINGEEAKENRKLVGLPDLFIPMETLL